MGGGAGMARKFMRNKNDVHMSPIRDIMKAQLLKQCGIGKKKKKTDCWSRSFKIQKQNLIHRGILYITKETFQNSRDESLDI